MSILTTIGIGSGIDTSTLVGQLVAAQRETRDLVLTTKSEKLTAQISGIALLKSGITNFSTALKSLLAGGTLSTQPTSSTPTVLTTSAISGQAVPKTTSEVVVTALAAAQSVASKSFTGGADATVGTGKLTFTFGSATVSGGTMTGFDGVTVPAPVEVTIDSTNNTLAGVAAAINAKNAGLSATVVTDGTGARLVVKGATGAANAFTMAADSGNGTAGLSQLNYGPNTSTGSALKVVAADAALTVDGVAVTRSGNSIADLISGVKLELKTLGASTIGASSPTAAISTAMTDFVDAYNEVQSIIAEQTDKDTGSLNGDASVRQMRTMLSRLTSTALRASGHPATLAELGVRTNRDGTLTLDSARLAAVLASKPAEVEAMFNPTQSSSSALVRIVSTVGATSGGTFEATNLVAATAGTLTGTTASGFPLSLTDANRHFMVSLDGKTAVDVAVPIDSYANGTELAAALNAAIEANAAITVRASVTFSGGKLRAESKTAGATSSISIVPTNTTIRTRLGLNSPVATQGTNASGTIAGKPATASGNLLFADSSTAAKGLVIQPLAGSSSAVIGIDGGLFNALNAISTALTGTKGALYSAGTRLSKEQAELSAAKTKVASDADALKTRLTNAFAAMDSKVAAYKSTQSFLTQQVAAWNKDS